MYESRAIARYIATKYASSGTPLLPDDEKYTPLIDQALSVEASNFDPYVGGLAREVVFKKYEKLHPRAPRAYVHCEMTNLEIGREAFSQSHSSLRSTKQH